MSEKDRVIEGKKERQEMLDKLSLESGSAYTYDANKDDTAEGAGCLTNAKKAREKAQEVLDG